MTNCQICDRKLDNKLDPVSTDCGGDCMLCMADAGDPDILDQLWTFSFGQNHAHAFGGITLDKDSILGVVGTEEAARKRMFEWFGPKWSFCYRYDRVNLDYFPRGIVKWVQA